jgi:hypothetical protein
MVLCKKSVNRNHAAAEKRHRASHCDRGDAYT